VSTRLAASVCTELSGRSRAMKIRKTTMLLLVCCALCSNQNVSLLLLHARVRAALPELLRQQFRTALCSVLGTGPFGTTPVQIRCPAGWLWRFCLAVPVGTLHPAGGWGAPQSVILFCVCVHVRRPCNSWGCCELGTTQQNGPQEGLQKHLWRGCLLRFAAETNEYELQEGSV
jgi:hypothetical protein